MLQSGQEALGSQVVLNCARSGFGTWKLVDHDLLMPHNVTRHALDYSWIGCNKADAVASVAGHLIQDCKLFSSIPANVMEPGKHSDEIYKAFETTDYILDMSASETVARYLALDIKSPAKRISLFLNPTGEDLVLLSEDAARTKKLDVLEMQYYRAVACAESLKDHFRPIVGRRRYGQSCRDITVTLPQELVSLHAAVGSRALKEAFKSNEAQIVVWRSDTLGNVHRIDVATSVVVHQDIGDWKIIIDEIFLKKLQRLRLEKMPNETGGVLIGAFDLERRFIYIVDTVPSPPDSKEWPVLYIRGCQGLSSQVEEIAGKTYNMLEYIGEWHSHPGRDTTPSTDDMLVFSWLTDLMNRDGLPSVMMIAGDGRSSCFVGEMRQTECLLP